MRLIFLFCFVLLFVAPAGQIILSTRRIRGKTKLPIGVIAVMMLLLRILVSILSMVIALYNWPGTCGTGATGYAFLGFMISLIATPIIGIASYCKYSDLQVPEKQIG